MTDRRLRNLERTALSGDAEATAAWLTTLWRTGAIEHQTLARLAALDHAPARGVLGRGAPRPLRGIRNVERWIEREQLLDDRLRWDVWARCRGLSKRRHANDWLRAYREVLIPALLAPLLPADDDPDRQAEVVARQALLQPVAELVRPCTDTLQLAVEGAEGGALSLDLLPWGPSIAFAEPTAQAPNVVYPAPTQSTERWRSVLEVYDPWDLDDELDPEGRTRRRVLCTSFTEKGRERSALVDLWSRPNGRGNLYVAALLHFVAQTVPHRRVQETLSTWLRGAPRPLPSPENVPSA